MRRPPPVTRNDVIYMKRGPKTKPCANLMQSIFFWCVVVVLIGGGGGPVWL